MLNLLEIPNTLKSAIQANTHLAAVPCYIFDDSNGDEIRNAIADGGCAITIYPCIAVDPKGQIPGEAVGTGNWMIALDIIPSIAGATLGRDEAWLALIETVTAIDADDDAPMNYFEFDGMDLEKIDAIFSYTLKFSRQVVLKLRTE